MGPNNMKYLASLLLCFIFVYCNSYDNTRMEEPSTGTKPPYFKDLNSLLNLDRNCVNNIKRIISYSDTINYKNEINQIIFNSDTITYIEDSNGRKNISLYNGVHLRKYSFPSSKYNIDSLDIVLDLNLLDVCYLKGYNGVIIKTIPMNWVGTMSNYYYYQLINKNDNSVVEFIKKE